jgi:altronate dehydratase large subunit
MGAVRKGGTTALMEVIGYGDEPTQRGLVYMDAPAPGVENITALAASGAQMILFSTGVGNPIGHPLVPTIKLTGNPATAETFADNIDVDVGGIVRGSYGLGDAALIVREALLETACGALTQSERLGDLEVSISRVDVGYLRRRALGEVF